MVRRNSRAFPFSVVLSSVDGPTMHHDEACFRLKPVLSHKNGHGRVSKWADEEGEEQLNWSKLRLAEMGRALNRIGNLADNKN